ncbi:5-hydroxytryptamine receptor 1-like isoform X1 [Macrobrachium rosenbergii]|uniref:5-hydroxytryptamine receptor 1-like isoform X1 n=1 Tax=Macrobrachium rosenbergii TaxID=79674 RepID=UPI0034D6D816
MSVGVESPSMPIPFHYNTTTQATHFLLLLHTTSEAAHALSAGTLAPMIDSGFPAIGGRGYETGDPFNVSVVGGGHGEVAAEEGEPEGLFTTLLTVMVLLFIIVGTVIGNLLVCVAVCLVRKLRRPYNYLLVSLAVSDLCVALLVMPMALLYELLGEWQFGRLACDVWVSFDVLSCAASILNLCMISVDRYLAITKPLEYGVKRTPRRMVAYIAFVWLGAAFISLPPILILGNEHGDGGSTCEVCQNFWYQIYATFGSFYIPLTVMVIVYYKIFCAAKRIVDEERKAQAHLRLVEETEADAKAAVMTTYAQLKPVSKTWRSRLLLVPKTPYRSLDACRDRTYSVVEVNNGGVKTKLAADSPLQHKEETGSTNTTESPRHLEVPTSLVVCSSSLSTTASAGSTMGSRWSLCETNGKVHPPNTTTGLTANQQSPNTYNCNNICKTTNGTEEDGQGSPKKKAQPHKSKLRFVLAKERKASTTLGIIMSAFVVCWLPFFVLALVRPFLKRPSVIPAWVSSLFLWLGYANSLLNPIIYATLNKDFRKPFQEILCLRCASLNILMREEFYHSQYGGPDTPTLSAVRTNTATNPRNSSELHLTLGDVKEIKVPHDLQNESSM